MNNTKKDTKFVPKEITLADLNTEHTIDLPKLYERAHDELTLQQTKRDHIITLYLSIFSLIIPFALSLESLNTISKGLIFFAISLIGVIFSLIAIRYRIYKEIYWLCCETITCLMKINASALNKDIVQSLFYKSLSKKGNNFINKMSNTKKKWSGWLYFKKNIFSSETLHFIIIIFMTSILSSLGLYFILSDAALKLWLLILISAVLGIIVFVFLLIVYFINCQKVYSVLIDSTNSSFNKTFEKAWFLHFYIDPQ